MSNNTQLLGCLQKAMLPYVVLLFFLQSSSAVNYYSYREPERTPPQWPNLLSINELALRGGYQAINYEVITEDGYSLWLHRIGNNSGPPVLLVHGLLVDAEQWIYRPNRDLAFLLLKEGYDVWLPNLRGTAFNEYSVKYNKSDPRFWNFSLHENGVYDLPAFVDTILDIRRVEQLFYIGYSQGTSIFFVTCSTRPEYNKKIRGAVQMSPIAYPPAISELAPQIRIVTSQFELIYRFVKSFGVHTFGFRTEQTINFLRAFCVYNVHTRVLCQDFIGLIAGEDRDNLNIDEWSFFAPYFFAGTSLNVVLHFGQIYSTGEFMALDLGAVANLEKYGRIKPPEYDLNLVTVPNALIWGRNDLLTSETSVKRIASDLPNVLLVKAVPDPKFNHVDMYLGYNAPQILYPDIIKIINSMLKK